MLIPRGLIYAPTSNANRWRGAVSATGCDAEVITDISMIDPVADFVVAEAPKNLAALEARLRNLREQSSSVVLAPSTDLVEMITLMRLPTVRSVVVADEINESTVSAVAAKSVFGDVFGLSKVVPWGVRVYSEAVGSYEDRLAALSAVGRFASGIGLRTKYREAIDTVLDELLMNALYNAPVDAGGDMVFSEVDPKDRLSMQVERPVLLQYACDGSRFLLAMRDGFGSLQRRTALDYIERCARSSGAHIERKTSGAGLGLYIIANHVTELVFNSLPGVATEVVCVIDLKRPRQQLVHLGFHEHRELAHGGDVMKEGTRPRPRFVPTAAGGRASTPRLTLALVVASVLLLLAAGIFVALPYVRAPATGGLQIKTDPPGAVIYVSGVRRGRAKPSLTIKGLPAERAYSLSARLDGYDEAREVVTVKTKTSVSVLLTLRAKGARLRVSSMPPGASIHLDGRDTGKTTPALLVGLKSRHPYRVRLTLHGHGSTQQIVKLAPGESLRLHSRLPVGKGFARLTLDSQPAGARLYINDVDTGKVTPLAEHPLPSGQAYNVSLRLSKRVPWTMRWTPRSGAHLERSVKLVFGGRLKLSANVKATARIDKSELTLPIDQLIRPGRHKVWIRSRWPLRVSYRTWLVVKRGETVRRNLSFVRVRVKQKGWLIVLPGVSSRVVGLLSGKQRVRLYNSRTKRRRSVKVDISDGKSFVIDIDELEKKGGKTKSGKKGKASTSSSKRGKTAVAEKTSKATASK